MAKVLILILILVPLSYPLAEEGADVYPPLLGTVDEELLRQILREQYAQEAEDVILACRFSPWLLEKGAKGYIGPPSPLASAHCLEKVLALQEFFLTAPRQEQDFFLVAHQLRHDVSTVVAEMWKGRMGETEPSASRHNLLAALAYAAFTEVLIRDFYRQRAEFLQ